MGLVDSHAHLNFPGLIDQLDDVLDRAATAGVDKIINISTSPEDITEVVSLARAWPGRVYATVGFHPHEASKITADHFELMQSLAKDPAVVAVGEIGLDYHYDFSPRDVQKEVFVEQLQLARTYDMPVVIHSREAIPDTVDILVDNGLKDQRVVFHCFGGSEEEAKLIADHGWNISFTGVVTFKKATVLHRIAAAYPANKLMIETDCPYLAPVPKRGKRPNEPAFLAYTARFLAELRDVDYDELVAQTAANTKAFFNL